MQKVSNKVSAIEGDGLKTFGGTAIKKTLGKKFTQRYKKSFYNKQFNLDRISSTIGSFTTKVDGAEGINTFVPVAKDFIWWFQDFKTGRANSSSIDESPLLGKVTDKRSIKERLTDLPKTKAINKDGIINSFEIVDLDDESDRPRLGTYVMLFNTTNILIEQLENRELLEAEVKSLLSSN